MARRGIFTRRGGGGRGRGRASPAAERGAARQRSRRRAARERDTAPEQAGRGGRERQGGSDIRQRVLWAVPAAIFAIVIIAEGWLVFALGVSVIGIIALHELFALTRSVRPVDIAGFVALVGVIMAALFGGPSFVMLALAAAFPLTFAIALARPWREQISWSIAITLFGVLWIGLPLAHAVFLREIEPTLAGTNPALDRGGALLVDALLATFVGDSVALWAGRRWGKRKLAPWVSPNKTWEGLLAGIVGGTLVVVAFEALYQDSANLEFLTAGQAALIGVAATIAAPIGDLFESLFKRDLNVKDTGGLLGPHGGVLDRLDAVFFSVPTVYYVSLLLL